MFVQSHVPEVTELHTILSMVAGLGKLTELPTFKDKIRQQPENVNYGLLGYPVLMTADIVLYKSNIVPVGIDQAPHLEFARELVRSFNYRYKTEVLIEPQIKMTEVPKVLGIDGKEKMSKSLNNHIELAATPAETEKRILEMVTDPARVRRSDPGNPDICNVYTMHKSFSPAGRCCHGERGVPASGDWMRGLQVALCPESESSPRAISCAPAGDRLQTCGRAGNFGRRRPAGAEARARHHERGAGGGWTSRSTRRRGAAPVLVLSLSLLWIHLGCAHLLQRVTSASVQVRGETVSQIGHGLLILLGIGQGDGEDQAKFLAEKIANLRIFEDNDGKMNLSVVDVSGEAIVVSQFTLYADATKGRRPSFIAAALPLAAEPLVERFVELLREHGVPTQGGAFGEHMAVEIHNDGPVTIWLEREAGPGEPPFAP